MPHFRHQFNAKDSPEGSCICDSTTVLPQIRAGVQSCTSCLSDAGLPGNRQTPELMKYTRACSDSATGDNINVADVNHTFTSP